MERQRWLVAALVGASLAWLWLLAGCAGARLSPVAPTPALCTGDSIDGDCASVAGTQEPPSLQVMAAAPVQRAPADERYLGALDAPVVLIEYGDYQ